VTIRYGEKYIDWDRLYRESRPRLGTVAQSTIGWTDYAWVVATVAGIVALVSVPFIMLATSTSEKATDWTDHARIVRVCSNGTYIWDFKGELVDRWRNKFSGPLDSICRT
jgi:hypothetical protein